LLGIAKVGAVSQLTSHISGDVGVPEALATASALAMIAGELVLGSVLIVMPWFTRLSRWARYAMLASTVTSASVLLYLAFKRPATTCGCFGEFFVATYGRRLTVAAGLLFLSATSLLGSQGARKREQRQS
jgi:hypothetical protein